MGRNSSKDNQERRSGDDRRKFSFALHIPERRSGKERRKGSALRQNRKSSNQEDASEKRDIKLPIRRLVNCT
jgi:hypothetical protein